MCFKWTETNNRKRHSQPSYWNVSQMRTVQKKKFITSEMRLNDRNKAKEICEWIFDYSAVRKSHFRALQPNWFEKHFNSSFICLLHCAVLVLFNSSSNNSTLTFVYIICLENVGEKNFNFHFEQHISLWSTPNRYILVHAIGITTRITITIIIIICVGLTLCTAIIIVLCVCTYVLI